MVTPDDGVKLKNHDIDYIRIQFNVLIILKSLSRQALKMKQDR